MAARTILVHKLKPIIMRYRELSLSIWLLALSAFGVKVPILPEPITHWVDAKQKIAMARFLDVKHKKHRK